MDKKKPAEAGDGREERDGKAVVILCPVEGLSMLPLTQRITSHSAPEPNAGCLLWTGELNSMGYGRIQVHGKKRLAHRVAYEAFVGPIPTGMQVCHRCDVRSCVEPRHLFLGTQKDNMRDALRKGRHRAPTGTANGKAKLSPASVAEIRRLRSLGGTQRTIASAIGVSEFCVWSVLSGRTWSTSDAQRSP